MTDKKYLAAEVSRIGAVKHDQGKPDLSMISQELVNEVAKVRMFGAKKYSRGGWKKGFKVSRSCAAALRHIFAFLSGETHDPESGELHLSHAVCSLEHAIYDMINNPANDDRNELNGKEDEKPSIEVGVPSRPTPNEMV